MVVVIEAVETGDGEERGDLAFGKSLDTIWIHKSCIWQQRHVAISPVTKIINQLAINEPDWYVYII